MVSCGLGIVHLLLVQMAAGGGMLLFYFEGLRRRGRSKYAGQFITGSFQRVVLISFILGTLTGLAMWLVIIQLDPTRIGNLVDQFHWIWATEWTFFCVQVVAGYAYLRYQHRLGGKDRLRLLALYSVAAWFSLFWMNAIVSSPIPSGRSTQVHRIWSVFLTSGFWPTLVSRTLAALAIAGLAACITIKVSAFEDRIERQDVMGHALKFLAPMVLMPLLGAWLMASLGDKRPFWGHEGRFFTNCGIGITAVASLAVGACGLCAPRYGKLELGRSATVLLCASVFVATAGSELLCQAFLHPDSRHQASFSAALPSDDRPKERP
jgi:hypothetical protein